MSVRVSSVSSAPRVQRGDAMQPTRSFALAKGVAAFLCYAALFFLILCAVAFAKVALLDGSAAGWAVSAGGALAPWAASAALFAQLTCGFAAYYAVARQARAVVSQAAERGTVFCVEAGRRVRLAAAAFLLLALAELAFSLLFLAAQGQPLLPVNVGFGFAGFPSGWSELAAGAGSSAFVAQIDTTALVTACFLWGLSYVFDHGAQLQSDQDATI